MKLAHKIRLNPDESQEIHFKKACGVARFAWNWALGRWNELYQAGGKPKAFNLKKEFNSLKDSQFSFVYEVTKYASQQPFIFLGQAFTHFFRSIKKGKKNKHHYPKFKKKGKCVDSFYIGGDQVKILGNRVKIPNLGWVEMTESLRWSGSILSATVSRQADKWFISFCVEAEITPMSCESQASVGVDLGINTLATLSDGTTFKSSKPLTLYQHRLKRLQRTRSKKQVGSHNFQKARLRESRLHYKIHCIRKDLLHKLTTEVTKQYKYICIEDLNVKGMLANRKLARAISDIGFYEFKRQILYKAQMKGNVVFLASTWFASSKTCSQCHLVKKELALKDRIFHCESCGLVIDRDLNAARNLENQLYTESSSGIYACGQDGSYDLLEASHKPAWWNQEKEPVQICTGF